MIHTKHRVVRMTLTAVTLASLSALALAAGLKNKPPEGVKLANTEWQLDPYHSDDPSEAIDRASRVEQRSGFPDRSSNGGVFGNDDPFGRGRPSNDPVGGGTNSPGGSIDRERTRGWPSGRDSNSIDPTGGGGNISMQFGTRRGSIFMESLRTNPAKVSFAEGNQYITVTADGLETECEAGVKTPFSDSYGDGERNCGWNGRAWVVETKRPQFSRTDRYELSKDGRTLRYTTTAKEDGIGRVTIERRYQIPVPTK